MAAFGCLCKCANENESKIFFSSIMPGFVYLFTKVSVCVCGNNNNKKIIINSHILCFQQSYVVYDGSCVSHGNKQSPRCINLHVSISSSSSNVCMQFLAFQLGVLSNGTSSFLPVLLRKMWSNIERVPMKTDCAKMIAMVQQKTITSSVLRSWRSAG